MAEYLSDNLETCFEILAALVKLSNPTIVGSQMGGGLRARSSMLIPTAWNRHPLILIVAKVGHASPNFGSFPESLRYEEVMRLLSLLAPAVALVLDEKSLEAMETRVRPAMSI